MTSNKIKNPPVRFSERFGVSPEKLADLGVLDPSLNIDTALFIDPLLVVNSAHAEISNGARQTYIKHFELVIKLLRASSQIGDVPWRSARKMMEFPEAKWTCLGYGTGSVSGSGSGAFITDGFMQTAKEIVDLGVDDPDLFVAMGLFEVGIGPDRISDMSANVILSDLLELNRRVLSELPAVATRRVQLSLKNGKRYEAELPLNPFFRNETPIVLVPTDILRDLPIAKDWSEISDAASKGAALRSAVNDQIADIWRSRTLKDKDELKRWALNSREAFEDILAAMKKAQGAPYDIEADPAGEFAWRRVAQMLSTTPQQMIARPDKLDAAGVAKVVEQIIEGFRFFIEDRRLSEELYSGNKVRPEKSAQRLFFVSAYAFCKANDLDITPEADTGNGPVDFKVSSGFAGRVLVEIKLSTNTKLVAGYSRQLERYKDAEETTRGFYVVIDVGSMGEKDKRLIEVKNRCAALGQPVSPIIFVDGLRRPSASKLEANTSLSA